MTAETAVAQAPAHDLREAVGGRRLIELVLTEVQRLENSFSTSSAGLSLNLQQRRLLTLLVYCYAAGNYGSEDIAWLCANDRDVRYAAANARPSCETIREFRRAHRNWIEACVAGVISAAGQSECKCVPARKRLEIAIMMDTAMCD